MKTYIKYFKALCERYKRKIELMKYNDFTIAEYFRKQGARIGENNRIEVRSLGAEPYLVMIGDHCTIAPGVCFLCHDGGTWVFTDEIPSLQKFGTIKILDNCFIGLGALILPNVVIGPNSIVGAGSVVTKDVPQDSIVAGNPARVISTVQDYKKKVVQYWAEQMPPGYFKDVEGSGRYSPQYIQAMKFRDMEMLKNHLINVCWKK